VTGGSKVTEKRKRNGIREKISGGSQTMKQRVFETGQSIGENV
jgi:hypothetical protein